MAEVEAVPVAEVGPVAAKPGAAHLLFVRIPHVLTGMIFIVAASINIVNVLARYLFAAPIFWAEEVLIFLVIWAVFLGAVSITFKGAHIAMDLFYAKMSGRMKRAVNALVAVTFIVSAAFTAVQSARVVLLHYRTGGVSTAAEIPLVVPHAAVLFGFSFMTLAVALRLRAYVTGAHD